MDNRDVIRYVVNTPENTNPNVLNDMLNGLGGSGDMLAADYDADGAVKEAGGIAAYVEEHSGGGGGEATSLHSSAGLWDVIIGAPENPPIVVANEYEGDDFCQITQDAVVVQKDSTATTASLTSSYILLSNESYDYSSFKVVKQTSGNFGIEFKRDESTATLTVDFSDEENPKLMFNGKEVAFVTE